MNLNMIDRDDDTPFNPDIHEWLTAIGFAHLRLIEGYAEEGEHNFIVPIPPLDWYGNDDCEVIVINTDGHFLCHGVDVITAPISVVCVGIN